MGLYPENAEKAEKLKTGKHPRKSGNALIEYVVPMALILIAGGIINSITDADSIMAQFYMSISGRSASSLQGNTFVTNGLGQTSVE